jgi:hypothetical protein
MARLADRLPDIAPGDWYVDSRCIFCEWLSNTLLTSSRQTWMFLCGHNDARSFGAHSWFEPQPDDRFLVDSQGAHRENDCVNDHCGVRTGERTGGLTSIGRLQDGSDVVRRLPT